jgi:hypothetical protein
MSPDLDIKANPISMPHPANVGYHISQSLDFMEFPSERSQIDCDAMNASTNAHATDTDGGVAAAALH